MYRLQEMITFLFIIMEWWYHTSFYVLKIILNAQTLSFGVTKSIKSQPNHRTNCMLSTFSVIRFNICNSTYDTSIEHSPHICRTVTTCHSYSTITASINAAIFIFCHSQYIMLSNLYSVS